MDYNAVLRDLQMMSARAVQVWLLGGDGELFNFAHECESFMIEILDRRR